MPKRLTPILRFAVPAAVQVLTVVSLIACAGGVFLWARSYSGVDAVGYVSRRVVEFVSKDGIVRLRVVPNNPNKGNEGWHLARVQWSGTLPHTPDSAYPVPPGTTHNWEVAGFGYWAGGPPGVYEPTWRIRVPHWFLAALTAIAPTLSLRRVLRASKQRARRARGLCTKCGYDLRVSKDRCPECGTAIPPQERGEDGGHC